MGSKTKFIKSIISGAQKARKHWFPDVEQSMNKLIPKAVKAPKYSKVRDTTASAIKQYRYDKSILTETDELTALEDNIPFDKFKRESKIRPLHALRWEKKGKQEMLNAYKEYDDWFNSLPKDEQLKVKAEELKEMEEVAKLHKQELEEYGKLFKVIKIER